MKDVDMVPILATHQKLLEDLDLTDDTSAILTLAFCVQELTKEVCDRLDELNTTLYRKQLTIEREGL